MEIKINKEIKEYSETVFFGLSLRQCMFSALACILCALAYFGTKDVLGNEITSWLCITAAVPPGLFGFVRFNGMPFEKLAVQFIKTEILTPERLLYRE